MTTPSAAYSTQHAASSLSSIYDITPSTIPATTDHAAIHHYPHLYHPPTPHLTYRSIQESDLPQLTQLHTQLFPVTYNTSFFTSFLDPQYPTATLLAVERSSISPTGHDRIVAFVTIRIRFDVPVLPPANTLLSNTSAPQSLPASGRNTVLAAVLGWFQPEAASATTTTSAPEASASENPTRNEAYVATIGVIPEYQHRHLASFLLHAIELSMTAHNLHLSSPVHAMVLNVKTDNTTALHMYRKAHYRVECQRLHHYHFSDGSSHHAYQLAKALHTPGDEADTGKGSQIAIPTEQDWLNNVPTYDDELAQSDAAWCTMS